MLEFITNFGTGILGFAMYLMYTSRDYIVTRTFNIKTMWSNNWKRGLWVILMVMLLAIIYKIVPEAFSQMSGLGGFKVSGAVEKGTFFGLSIGLSKYVKLLVKKNINS